MPNEVSIPNDLRKATLTLAKEVKKTIKEVQGGFQTVLNNLYEEAETLEKSMSREKMSEEELMQIHSPVPLMYKIKDIDKFTKIGGKKIIETFEHFSETVEKEMKKLGFKK